jgi:hypothetical protein
MGGDWRGIVFVGESGRVEGGLEECGADGPGHRGGKCPMSLLISSCCSERIKLT